ncbi:MAG: porin, partial [Bradyrhizobium sp.]|uniref:porin n=2 Tax=Bradyrhizobium sp. TaxID=376 RepID=UPI003C5A8B17
RRTLVPRLFWGTYVKRTFISAAAILAFTAAGHADELSDIQAQAKQLRDQNATMTRRLADLEKRQKALETQKPVLINPVDAMAADLPYKAAVKARPPENDDICIKGICVYGNFDMGATYIQHSAPFAGSTAGPLDVLVSRNGGMGSYFGVGANQISTSFIGLRGKQEIGDNLYAVFNLQTLFNPASGMNANGTATIAQNNGLPFNNLQNSYGDSSKGGQMFNNAAYFGLSSPTYGTFTMGRQSALTSDLVVNYDPLSGSNSWSVITFQGANGGGGDTENRIYDNSYEYRVNVGPVRFAAEVQAKNGGNSGTGNAFEGNVGFDYMGFSLDVVGGKIFDAVGSSPLGLGVGVNPAVAMGNGQLTATVSDDTVFSVGARYTIGPWKLFGGYEHINYSNPNNPLLPGAFLQGGFIAGAVNNLAFPSDKILQTAWFGVRYSITPALDITGAYYHEWDNTFATAPATLAGCAVLGSSSSQCAGTLDAVSAVIDWRFARHVDVYAGVMWSQVTGGLANNFFVNNAGLTTQAVGSNRSSNFDPGVGLRYQF